MVKLIKANLRKDRAILIVFLLIIILSALLLHTGLLVSDYKGLYNIYAQETNLADYMIFTSANDEDIKDCFDSKEYVDSFAVYDGVFMNRIKMTTSKSAKEKDCDFTVQNVKDNSGADELIFIERDDSVEGRKIYLNLYTAYSNGLCTGDKVYLSSELGEYEYTVAGIYQHLLMGNSYYLLSAMVDEDSFDELKAAAAGTMAETKLVFTHCKEGFDPGESMSDSIVSLRKYNGATADGYGTELAEFGYTAVVNILAGFMAAFALIIFVICIIMIIFTINNNISRDVINIGALKAVGHTVGQIRAALTAEFVLLGSAGAVIGIALSYALYPVLEYLYIREISGLVWENGFYPIISAGVLVGILIVIVVSAFVSTVKIRSLHPATALRFGLRSNSFKKNHLPLADTKGELNMLLAAKSAMQNVGQNVIIFCIIAAVSFVTLFSSVLYYNTKVDITNFQRMIQGDVPDAFVNVKDSSPEAVMKTIERLKEVDGVSQAYGLDSETISAGEKNTDLIYITDPDCVYCGVYEGEMLSEDNEAVIGSILADRLGLGVGDEINVSFGDNSERFLITGLQQAVGNERVYVTHNAAEQLLTNASYSTIRVRIKDATSERVEEVLKSMEELDDNIQSTENYYRYQRSNENTPVYAVGFIVMILIFLNIATVLLVIRLLLKTVFVKSEKEFGIKKAVGFTSSQLRYQLSLSLLPTTILAAVTGAISGYILTNPMFGLVLGGYGVRNSDLIIKPYLMILPIAAVTILVFVFSFIMSGKMKKLSAYKLIQE